MLLNPHAARSAILHALADRPMMTTSEIVARCGAFEFVFTSYMVEKYCDVCEGPHYREGRTEICRYPLTQEAYRLLRGLERAGRVRRLPPIPGARDVGWTLIPAAARHVDADEVGGGC